MKKALLIIGLISCLSGFSAVAVAAPVLDFGTGFAGEGGTLTYDSTTSIISGTGIGLDALFVAGTSHDSVYDLSGPFVGRTNAAVLNFNFDTKTNSGLIEVTGYATTLGINADTILLSGTIDSFNVSQNGIFVLIEMQGRDEKNTTLLNALGLDPTPFVFQGFSMSYINDAGQVVAFSTDLANTPVPVPSAILLLGGGLAGLAVIKRRLRV